jgi:hypothetical protein
MKASKLAVLSVFILSIAGCASNDTPDKSDAADSKDKDETKPEQETQQNGAADGDKSKPESTGTYVEYPDLRGSCDIHSNYPDDFACVPPPAKGEGFQIHVGPSNYDDPEEVAKFILHPGEERSQCFTFRTPNEEPVYYQTALLSGRSGTHHIINTMYDTELEEGSFGPCGAGGDAGGMEDSLGSLPGASKPYMPRLHVAPENEHIGRTIKARTFAQADMHYYNFTDHDIVREFWLNIYTVDGAKITSEAEQIRGMGGFGWNRTPIPAGHDEVYKYACPIKGEGRILSLLGHYHAHGKRFTASLTRASGGEPEKVFEMYDYLDPATFEYDSKTQNPTFSDVAPGATTGMLDVHDGDTLAWECHIVNDSNVGLRYVNEVKTGEMCNLWGTSIGIEKFDCLKQ